MIFSTIEWVLHSTRELKSKETRRHWLFQCVTSPDSRILGGLISREEGSPGSNNTSCYRSRPRVSRRESGLPVSGVGNLLECWNCSWRTEVGSPICWCESQSTAILDRRVIPVQRDWYVPCFWFSGSFDWFLDWIERMGKAGKGADHNKEGRVLKKCQIFLRRGGGGKGFPPSPSPIPPF